MKHQRTVIYGLIGLALLALAWYYRDRLKQLPKTIGIGDVPTPPGATVDEQGNLVLPEAVTAPGSSETFFDLNTGPGQIALDELTRELALEGLPGNVDLENVFKGLSDFNFQNEDNAAEYEAALFENNSIEDFMRVAFRPRFDGDVREAKRLAEKTWRGGYSSTGWKPEYREQGKAFIDLSKNTGLKFWDSTTAALPSQLIGRFASSTNRRPARWNDRMISEAMARYVNMTAVFLANIQDEAKRLQNSARPQAIEMLRARGWKFIQTDSPNRTGR